MHCNAIRAARKFQHASDQTLSNVYSQLRIQEAGSELEGIQQTASQPEVQRPDHYF